MRKRVVEPCGCQITVTPHTAMLVNPCKEHAPRNAWAKRDEMMERVKREVRAGWSTQYKDDDD